MEKIGQLIERVAAICFKILCRAINRECTPEMLNTFQQFVKFGIVGLSNTLISYLIYFIVLLAERAIYIFKNSDYIIAQIVAFLLSVLWSFFWNNKYVFQAKENEERQILSALFKTYISYSFTGIFLNSILLVIWVKGLGISEFIAPIINLLISVPVNFLLNKFWAFRQKSSDK